ncbi:MAG: hypothetical protein EA342_18400 [Leptolyngbya sp. LCM1.Bin17]|nr:MAG: hypothetical protein EA342_18400 [Leptolyngbya sp. LCM1.Bin17]
MQRTVENLASFSWFAWESSPRLRLLFSPSVDGRAAWLGALALTIAAKRGFMDALKILQASNPPP